jgi:integrase
VGEVIRKTKRGKFIGFYLRFYDASGQRRQIASKQPTQADAKRMLLQIEARIARGEVGITEPVSALTVAELVERFLAEYCRPSIKNIERYRTQKRSSLKKALPMLGRLTHPTAEQLAAMRDALLRRRLAPGTVRNVLSALGAMFTWARKRGLVQVNPCRDVEKPAAEFSLDFLTRAEVERLLTAAAAASPLQHVAVALALYTGLRKGELFGLRWQDIDLGTRRLTVARSFNTTPKNGKARHLRLPAMLIPILQDWQTHCPASSAGLVLPFGRAASRMPSPDAMCGLPKLLRTAGIRCLSRPWHALRHTFASHYMMNGGSVFSLSKILGHADLRITTHYAHLAPDYLADEMDRVKF